MSGDPRETFQRLQRVLQQRTRGGIGGAGGPGGSVKSIVSLVLLGVGGVALSNSLFNGKYIVGERHLDGNVLADVSGLVVDGGHRAIKYTRVGGVQKDIYDEGLSPYLL
jgi:prohibitin 2